MRAIEDISDLRLSHSSAKELQTCEERWAHRKLRKTPHDPDYQDGDHLSIGSAVHWLAETFSYKMPKGSELKRALKKLTKNEDVLLKPENYGVVVACFKRAVDIFKRVGMKLVVLECSLSFEERFTGFADAVVMDKKGKWWIADLKNYSRFDGSNVAGLGRDFQLSLYAAHAFDLAEQFDLVLEDFAGVMLWVTVKSRLKRGKHETLSDYVYRLYDNTKGYIAKVPLSQLDLDTAIELHDRLWERSVKIRKGAKPMRNYGSCMNYFKPCPYWSKCHGRTHSAGVDSVEVIQVGRG